MDAGTSAAPPNLRGRDVCRLLFRFTLIRIPSSIVQKLLSPVVDEETQSSSALVYEILIELQRLVNQKFRLLQRSIRTSIQDQTTSIVILLVGLALLFASSNVLAFSLVYLLHEVGSTSTNPHLGLSLWSSHAIIGISLGVLGCFLAFMGASRIREAFGRAMVDR